MREVAGDILAPGRQVTVVGTGLADAPVWAFAAGVLSDDGEKIVLRVREGTPVSGPDPWSMPAGGRYHLWRSRHYSILATTRGGRFPYWYCPVHTPPQVLDGELRVTDLGLDVQLFADGRYSIGGEEALPARLPAPLVAPASSAIQELVAMIARQAAPFTAAG